MPFVPIPDTCKVELLWSNTHCPNPIANVMHAKCPASPTTAQLHAIGTCFEAFGDELLANLFPSSTTLVSVTTTDLNSATGPQDFIADGTAGASGTVGVGGACALLALQTATRGRSFRGRVFLGPLTDLQVANNTLSSGVASVINTAFGHLVTNLAGLTPASGVVVASRTLAQSFAVTTYATEAEPAYQRRRAGR